MIKLEGDTKRVEVHDWKTPKEFPVWSGITANNDITNETKNAHSIELNI